MSEPEGMEEMLQEVSKAWLALDHPGPAGEFAKIFTPAGDSKKTELRNTAVQTAIAANPELTARVKSALKPHQVLSMAIMAVWESKEAVRTDHFVDRAARKAAVGGYQVAHSLRTRDGRQIFCRPSTTPTLFYEFCSTILANVRLAIRWLKISSRSSGFSSSACIAGSG